MKKKYTIDKITNSGASEKKIQEAKDNTYQGWKKDFKFDICFVEGDDKPSKENIGTLSQNEFSRKVLC